jgi:hypothetical protein
MCFPAFFTDATGCMRADVVPAENLGRRDGVWGELRLMVARTQLPRTLSARTALPRTLNIVIFLTMLRIPSEHLIALMTMPA